MGEEKEDKMKKAEKEVSGHVSLAKTAVFQQNSSSQSVNGSWNPLGWFRHTETAADESKDEQDLEDQQSAKKKAVSKDSKPDEADSAEKTSNKDDKTEKASPKNLKKDDHKDKTTAEKEGKGEEKKEKNAEEKQKEAKKGKKEKKEKNEETKDENEDKEEKEDKKTKAEKDVSGHVSLAKTAVFQQNSSSQSVSGSWNPLGWFRHAETAADESKDEQDSEDQQSVKKKAVS